MIAFFHQFLSKQNIQYLISTLENAGFSSQDEQLARGWCADWVKMALEGEEDQEAIKQFLVKFTEGFSKYDLKYLINFLGKYLEVHFP